MAMLRHRAARGSDAPRCTCSSPPAARRTPSTATSSARIDRRGAAWTFTRSAPPGWDGFARRVDAAMLAEVGPAPAAGPRCFVCGPTPFVEQATSLLVAAGHDPRMVHAERFGPTGGTS